MLLTPLICVFLCVHYACGKIQKDHTSRFVNTCYLEWVALGEEDSLKKKQHIFLIEKKERTAALEEALEEA